MKEPSIIANQPAILAALDSYRSAMVLRAQSGHALIAIYARLWVEAEIALALARGAERDSVRGRVEYARQRFGEESTLLAQPPREPSIYPAPVDGLCAKCRGGLEERHAEGETYWRCEACGYIHRARPPSRDAGGHGNEGGK